MDKIPAMVDLKKTPEEKQEEISLPNVNMISDYPYGLCLHIDKDTLDKLGFDLEDLGINDMIHFHAMAVVTSKSMSANQISDGGCVELQITHMSAESEDEENEEEEAEEDKDRPSKLYKMY